MLDWLFEPCSPEDVCDPAGLPWAHAVRGRKPARPVITGYGHTPGAADADARTKATQYDAREMLGERGEVTVTSDNLGGFAITPEMWEACRRFIDAGVVVKAKLGGVIMQPKYIATIKVTDE